MLFENERANTILISIIWGFGVASLFRKICDNNKCIVIKAPSDINSYHENNKKNVIILLNKKLIVKL